MEDHRISLGQLSAMQDHTNAARNSAVCTSKKSSSSCKQTLQLPSINSLELVAKCRHSNKFKLRNVT